MMSQKWVKRIVCVMAVVLALVIAGSIFLPAIYAHAAPLTVQAVPATGDKLLMRMLVILCIAMAAVAAGIVVSVIKKRKLAGKQDK